MKDKEAAALIAKCPSVHRLCYGTFLQSPMWISEDVLAMPLCPLGFNAELA
jgi:hypothetical protein